MSLCRYVVAQGVDGPGCSYFPWQAEKHKITPANLRNMIIINYQNGGTYGGVDNDYECCSVSYVLEMMVVVVVVVVVGANCEYGAVIYVMVVIFNLVNVVLVVVVVVVVRKVVVCAKGDYEVVRYVVVMHHHS